MHVLSMHGKLYALYLQIIASIVSLKKQITVWQRLGIRILSRAMQGFIVFDV